MKTYLEASILSLIDFHILSSISTCSFPTTADKMQSEFSFGKDDFGISLSVVLTSGFKDLIQFFASATSYFKEFTVVETVFNKFSAYCVYIPCFTKQSFKKNFSYELIIQLIKFNHEKNSFPLLPSSNQ